MFKGLWHCILYVNIVIKITRWNNPKCLLGIVISENYCLVNLWFPFGLCHCFTIHLWWCLQFSHLLPTSSSLVAHLHNQFDFLLACCLLEDARHKDKLIDWLISLIKVQAVVNLPLIEALLLDASLISNWIKHPYVRVDKI